METLQIIFDELQNKQSEINEHIPTLYEYAKQSNSILSCGNKIIKSDWAFLKGLSVSDKSETNLNKKLIRVDNERLDEINFIEAVAYIIKINYSFIEENDLLVDVEPVDMVFINTWHIYAHLRRELIKFKDIAKKWIIIHNTTVDAELGETVRMKMNAEEQALKTGYPIEEINKGVWPAIKEFLEENSNFILEKHYQNNNGLTILRKL